MLTLRFWGTRGSIPVSGPGYTTYGGSTTCLEVIDPRQDARIILDCGSGLAALGRQLSDLAVDSLILQTHFHWDHVQGFPFFPPIYRPDTRLSLWATRHDGIEFADALNAQMRQPSFPVSLDMLPSTLNFRTLPQQGCADWRGLKISWTQLDHPSANTAYRIDHPGGSLVFSGDVEVQQGCGDQLAEFARGADIFVMDAQYTREEYRTRVGFGHSTPHDAVRVAVDAGVEALYMTHHDPTHTDAMLDTMLAQAREQARGRLRVAHARDGLEVPFARERPRLDAPLR